MFENCHLRIGDAPFASCMPLSPQLLASLYALPHCIEKPLREVLETLGDNVPWAESFAVAPEQTASAIATMLGHLIMATRDLEPGSITTDALPSDGRARIHIDALRDLWHGNPAIVPSDLAMLKAFLACEAAEALQSFQVIWDRNCTQLTSLERAVLEHLESHHGKLDEDDIDHVRLISDRKVCRAPASLLAGHVQRHLLDPSAPVAPMDDSLAVLSVRDALTECEAAAAIVQRWLAEDQTLAASEIGIILPSGPEYTHYLSEAFGQAGLTTSSLPGVPDRRNVGGETLLHFLQCRRRPAPAMALASLYCSPILCWPPDVGTALASAVMAGDFQPMLVQSLSGKQAALFSLIRSASPATNGQLKEQIRSFRRLLSDDELFAPDVAEAKQLASRLLAALGNANDAAEAELEKAIQMAAAYQAPPCPRGDYFLGGISVMLAHEAPKRQFRKLLVLGFNDGAYPPSPSGNPFFLDSEVVAIAGATGLQLPSQAKQLDAALELFARQIGAASEQVIFLLSERDRGGSFLSVSSSLPLISRLVAGLEDPESLVVPLTHSEGTIWDRLVAWKPRPVVEPLQPLEVPSHYEFDLDLLGLRKKDDGSPRAQSPSRLEKLLISPLAWVLAELGAEHVSWQPEALDVMLRGSLAHEVFERLFPPGKDHPSNEVIEEKVPELLLERIRAIAPFLQTSVWAVERNTLEAEITKAAKHWSMVLRSLDAEIVGNEFWLSGTLFGHPVHGKADCLLRLPDGQPIVVDYKKSSSGTRRQRLQKGWDLQVDLYRRMCVRIDERSHEGVVRIGETLSGWSKLPAVAYHTLNDGNVLLNGIEVFDSMEVELVAGDIAANALALISARFEALKAGRLETNTTADAKFFQKAAALGTYALEDSPLITAFMRDDTAPSVTLPDDQDD
ncbi:MAG: PD-(D/E)XK nuclease family protein [Nitrospiraceae bacterium]|nr:PD-(D/E)XK nuclease family protein [Nitrospiraceae bacterium]